MKNELNERYTNFLLEGLDKDFLDSLQCEYSNMMKRSVEYFEEDVTNAINFCLRATFIDMVKFMGFNYIAERVIKYNPNEVLEGEFTIEESRYSYLKIQNKIIIERDPDAVKHPIIFIIKTDEGIQFKYFEGAKICNKVPITDKEEIEELYEDIEVSLAALLKHIATKNNIF